MMPATTKKGGMCLVFPDVCKTPAAPSPIPIPYPNIGQVNGSKKTSTKVLMSNKETVVESSEISRSMGDEAGTLKGVVSSTNMGKVKYKTKSSKVKAEGKGVVMLTAMTAHNGSGNANAPPGMHIAPSQTKVLVSM